MVGNHNETKFQCEKKEDRRRMEILVLRFLGGCFNGDDDEIGEVSLSSFFPASNLSSKW